MILDGRAIAEDIYKTLEERRARIERPVRLGIVVGGHDPVIESFVRIKARAAARLNVEISRVDLPENATTDMAVNAVSELSGRTDAVIAQLPLPRG